jgi:GTP-binding protein
VVSEIPGTTRDALDSLVDTEQGRYLFVDTAGIRRSRHLKEPVDHVGVVQAQRSIERADVAILVLDAAESVREMDAKIGGQILEAGRAVVVAVNKWDLARELALDRRGFVEEIRRRMKFLSFAPVVFVSAIRGSGLKRLLSMAARVRANWQARVGTGELNRVVARACQAHTPVPSKGNRQMRILFAAQIGVAPPTIGLSVNQKADLHFSYRRYLENRLRDAFSFEGSPIVLKVRHRKH